MKNEQTRDPMVVLQRIETKIDAIRADREIEKIEATKRSAFAGGIAGAVVSVAVTYAQLSLGLGR